MSGEVTFGVGVAPMDAPGASDAEMYRTMLEDVDFYAELGYGTVWIYEHHFSDYYPTPSPLVLASHIAGRFPEVAIGTCVLVLPWYEPLRLAGEIAMLAQLSKQPIHLGIGRGTAKYEYDGFNLDMHDARERFREVYEIVRLGLKGEPFTYEGDIIQVRKRLKIRPYVADMLDDHVHFYGAIGSPQSASIMAELGLAPMCTASSDFDGQGAVLQHWGETAAAHGFSTDVTKPIMVHCIVGETDEAAIESAQHYIPQFMQMQVDHYTPEETDWEHLPEYAGWKGQFAGMQRHTDPAVIPGWAQTQLVGSPDTIAERIQSYVDLGFNHLFMRAISGVPHDVRREWARLFATEVAPRFDSGQKGRALAGVANGF